ncbi:aldehyde dehydrogenase [Shewanella colwelliana]|uniref:Aldehyde dehydrogenase PuuC n=1 Tax=Shewanella colwelliana TaxID=23 RepID=A0A1E5IQG8_SHECO|nr:aldehyde dehydrogenase [Shewanella colwelliana]MDX1279850.1 aldehyde dehydrogenase [Shewanella colwelliana]OEG72707.1 aldehyde dehydrogenase PuuC [Shewanella colwelliana]GIU41277.1 gamma-glutamyl-gamma-aminobutyraldehyde dehydrogenase [Shewanella colwelliana]
MSTPENREQWQQMADSLSINGQAFIDGEYCAAASSDTFDCISPVDGKVLVKVASCNEADANIAVANAREVFDRGDWSQMPPVKRKQVMIRFAELLEANMDELALLETLDMGKPIRYSRTVDVAGAARAIRWSGEAVDKIYDEIAPTAHNEIGMITREAVGVVAAIVPWNFPLLMACWKLGPALATGNSVVLKPSEKSPLTAIRMAQIALEAGLPKGVLNVLPGFGHTVGKALALHMDVDTLVFTGSTKIAKQLMIYAGESNMKRVWLEAGGKSPNIVFNDAPDLQKAAIAAASAIAFNQGEVCTAGSRLLVESGVKDELIRLIEAEMQAWQPGHPLDPETTCGAVVDQQQLDNVLRYIRSGVAEGAKLVQGGEQVMTATGGVYVAPTIFANVKNEMTIAKEEIFGPVLSVITFDGMDEAIRIGNDTIYGLAAGVWTSDINKAHKTAKALRSGMVWINHYDGGDMTAPFGGYKQSGNGRDKSLHAFDKYTEIKATWIVLD